LFVKSRLASAGVSREMDNISSTFGIKLHIVCRDDWLEAKLFARDFMDLVESERREICKLLKRDLLLEFIKKNSFKIWLSGIRKDQTVSRRRLDFLEVTDLNVIKISPMFNWFRQQTTDLLALNNLRCNIDYYDLCKVNESMEWGLHL
jgi:3'-phosphoadenosine 5'-phosphosulfate sulfotransferase (PAPS reductase)/FAD synthetase